MKELLDGYIGVEFRAQQPGVDVPGGVLDLYPLFRSAGERLSSFGMTPANGGNMSVRRLALA